MLAKRGVEYLKKVAKYYEQVGHDSITKAVSENNYYCSHELFYN